jgi:hypothetical protein
MQHFREAENMPKSKITPPLARHHGQYTVHLTAEGIELFNLKDCPEGAPRIRGIKQKGGKVEVAEGRVYVSPTLGVIAFFRNAEGAEDSFGLLDRHWTSITTTDPGAAPVVYEK